MNSLLKYIILCSCLLFIWSCDDDDDDVNFNDCGCVDIDETESEYFYGSGDYTSHYFDISDISDCSNATLYVTLEGDYGSSSEYVNLYINGNYYTYITPDLPYDCYPGGDSYTIYFDSSDISNWLSYSNSLYIELANSGSVSSYECNDYSYYYGPSRHTVRLTTGY